MRRPISILVALAVFAASTSPSLCAAGAPGSWAGPAPVASSGDGVVMKRDRKGIYLWGAMFLANSALLSMGVRDLGHYKDEGIAAQARGDDPEPYWKSYDRAGWIVAGACAGAVVSSVGLIQAAQRRPVSEEPPRYAAARPASLGLAPADQQPASDVATNPAGGAARPAPADPVAAAIADIERRAGAGAGKEVPAPIITGKVTTRTAWIPGTPVPPGMFAPKTEPATSDSRAGAPSENPIASDIEAGRAAEPPGGDVSTRSPAPPVAEVFIEAEPSIDEPNDEPIVVEREETDEGSSAAEDAAELPSETATEPAPIASRATETAQPPSAPASESVATPSAAPPSPAAPAPLRYFTVQVSSHRRKSDADHDAARWTALGYPAEVLAKDLGEKGIWHRVIMGKFGRASDAQVLAASLRERFPAQEATVVRR